MQPGNLGSALVFGALPALAIVGLVYWLDRYEKEPVRLLAIALGFGAILAPAVAVLVQSALDVPTSVAVQSTVPLSRLNITTPLVEEAVRALTVLAVMWLVRREVDTLLDGLVYGAVVGTGFGMAATFMAILTTEPIGTVDLTGTMFVAMVAGLNHTFYGAVVGLAIATVNKRPATAWAGAAAVGAVVAFGFHALHDYLPSWLASSSPSSGGGGLTGYLDDVPNFLGVMALAVLVVWAVGREVLLVEHELKDEVEAGVVTAEEYRIVSNSFERTKALWRALFTPESWKHRRRLYALEIELAFRKAHRRSGRPSSGMRSEDHYRSEIAETRRELVDAEGSAR